MEGLEIKKDINDLSIRATISIGVYQFLSDDENDINEYFEKFLKEIVY